MSCLHWDSPLGRASRMSLRARSTFSRRYAALEELCDGSCPGFRLFGSINEQSHARNVPSNPRFQNPIRELLTCKRRSSPPTENCFHPSASFYFLFFRILCFYWHVFWPDKQTINMTPLNAHILTPKINHAPRSPGAAGAPRTLRRSCSLTGPEPSEITAHQQHTAGEVSAAGRPESRPSLPNTPTTAH